MKKILIVDDEPTILISLSHALGGRDIAVVTCETMEEAEKALSGYSFDLVIADIRLSGIDGIEGLELLSYIKERNPATAVIIMTAFGSDEMRSEAYRRGAFFYFEKPINLEYLIAKTSQLGITPESG